MGKLNFKIQNHRKNEFTSPKIDHSKKNWYNLRENLAGHRFLEGHRFVLDYLMKNLLIPRIFRTMRSHENVLS